MEETKVDLPKKIILQTRLEEHTIIDLTSEVDWYDEICSAWKQDKETAILALKLVLAFGTVSRDLLKQISDKDDLDELYNEYMRVVEKKD